MMDAQVFAAYSRYYDLLYKDKDYKQEANYIQSLLKHFSPGAHSIFEMGSGTGIHACLLAEHGYTVFGIDKSETMLRKALDRLSDYPAGVSERVSFLQGDIRSYEHGHTVDACISLFHVMSYMAENEDLEQAIHTAKKHLKPGGVFIFDCWHGPAVQHDAPVSRTKLFSDDTISVKRVSVPEIMQEKNCVDVNFTIDIHDRHAGKNMTLHEVHRMRYLFTEELKSFLDLAGLEMIHAEEWLTKKPLSENTWNACYVCRNKA